MKATQCYLAVICALLLGLTGCSKDNPVGAGGFGVVTGKVVDITNSPIASAPPLAGVAITTVPPTHSVVTDTSGGFTLADVPAGSYTLTATLAGYADATINLTITDGQTQVLTLPMSVGSGSDSLQTPFNPMPPDGSVGQSTYLTLSWSAGGKPADSLRYDVYFGLNQAPPVVASDLPQSSLLQTGLDTGKVYYWRVVVKDKKGRQKSGPVWTFTTTSLLNNNAPAIPYSPSPANGAASQPYQLTLRWECSDPDADPLKYDVLFGTNPAPSDVVASDLTVKSYAVANLQQNATYYWRVIAKDNHNGVTSSPVWSFTVRTNLAPNAPNTPTPPNGATNQSLSLTLRWNASDDDADPLKFDIYLSENNPPTDLIASDIATMTFSRSGLQEETTYFWRVVAKDGHGGTTSGPVWSFTTKTNRAPNAPNTPTPADGAVDQSSGLTLRWNASDDDADPLTFDVYLSTNNPPTDLIANNVTPKSLTRSGLQQGITYYWRVVAKDGKGGVTSGPVWSFSTYMQAAPGLIAFYPFNGNANDESDNGHDGVVTGAALTTDRHGLSNSAYYFDGSGDYITVPHRSDLNFNGQGFTVAAWISFTGTQVDYAGIVAKGPAGTQDPGYMLVVLNNTQVSTVTGEIYWVIVSANRVVNDGNWHHVAVVMTASKEARVYVDGVMTASKQSDASVSIDFANTRPLYIGVERNKTQYFRGSIDDVKIYNYPLSDSDISTLAAQ